MAQQMVLTAKIIQSFRAKPAGKRIVLLKITEKRLLLHKE